MVIFLDLEGNAVKVDPQHVYQGSNNVTTVTVVAPYPSTTAMDIGFILPNGMYWVGEQNNRYSPMEFAEQDAVKGVSAWTYKLPRSVTSNMGDLYVAINAMTADGNTTSYMCKVVIEESVLPNLPTQPEPDVYELLRLYIARLDALTVNVPNLVADINKVAPNAFTFTKNNGIESAPIVLTGGELAPIPVNAASTINIPLDGWQPVYAADGTTVTGYKAVISAALHGQMRDNATARDLWVSFDEAEQEAFKGAYEDYTVDAAGNITVEVTTPIAMTVRVWNGKGIKAIGTNKVIRAEHPPAYYEENDLTLPYAVFNRVPIPNDTFDALYADLSENRIYQCVFEIVTVDETAQTAACRVTDYVEATDFVAAETERAKAAEEKLQENIDAEETRATTAEQGLQEQITANDGDIAELQSDKVDKVTTKPEPGQVGLAYIVGEQGQQTTLPVSPFAYQSTIAFRDGNGNVRTTDAVEPDSAVTKQQLDTKVNKSGDTIDGNLKINGKLDVRQAVTASGIGLFYTTPFIDFYLSNQGNKTGAKLICPEDGKLNCEAELYENNARVYSPNNPPKPADIGAATVEEAQHLQEQIDEFSAGTVASVNGKTGVVKLAATISSREDKLISPSQVYSGTVTSSQSKGSVFSINVSGSYIGNGGTLCYGVVRNFIVFMGIITATFATGYTTVTGIALDSISSGSSMEVRLMNIVKDIPASVAVQ